MKVELVGYTKDPDKVIANTARICYSSSGINDLFENDDPETTKRLISKLFTSGHTSTFEHVVFMFGIEEVSRSLTHQLVRHRMASYSQQSQRYVTLKDFKVVTPPSIVNNHSALEVYKNAISQINEKYKQLLELGISPEDARYILPNACESKIVVTMNARSLLNFFEIRTCVRAQWEIRKLALEMKKLVKEVAPLLFELSGTTCEISGYCREGKLGCGRFIINDSKGEK